MGLLWSLTLSMSREGTSFDSPQAPSPTTKQFHSPSLPIFHCILIFFPISDSQSRQLDHLSVSTMTTETPRGRPKSKSRGDPSRGRDTTGPSTRPSIAPSTTIKPKKLGKKEKTTVRTSEADELDLSQVWKPWMEHRSMGKDGVLTDWHTGKREKWPVKRSKSSETDRVAEEPPWDFPDDEPVSSAAPSLDVSPSRDVTVNGDDTSLPNPSTPSAVDLSRSNTDDNSRSDASLASLAGDRASLACADTLREPTPFTWSGNINSLDFGTHWLPSTSGPGGFRLTKSPLEPSTGWQSVY